MGALLDSTYFISAERRGLTAASALDEASRFLPLEPLAISVISVMELAHGITRAESVKRASLRELFLDRIMSTLDVHPVTPAIALEAGRLDGELTRQGIQVAFPDLLIGITALQLSFAVVTTNLRHFQRIGGLRVIQH